MRYIGNKENLLDKIFQILKDREIKGERFFDFFSGTTNVARFFKEKGYTVFSCDMLYLSYCLQKAYIENNEEPQFEQLLPTLPEINCSSLFALPLEKVVTYLNSIPSVEGFIYKNYTPDGTTHLERPRMYFSSENGKKIDAIRLQIEVWKEEKLITESEYYILISCLIETVSFYANISGVYAAFQKKWDPRAVKPLVLRTIKTINNGKQNFVYNTNSLNLVEHIETDILYLDPPYNERQYLPNYHLLETIAKYDSPTIKGITGMREYGNQKSSFCNAKTALEGLNNIAAHAKYKYLLLSYNSEGIMAQEDIIRTLEKYGKVTLESFEHLRFKSNNNGLAKSKKHIFEQLYILKNE